VRTLLEKKALDVVVLDVRSMSSFADFFIICSGSSPRQVAALAGYLEEALKRHGVRPLGVEGSQEARWVLVDCNDVIVHIFSQPWREFYDLEGLWLEAPREFPTSQEALSTQDQSSFHMESVYDPVDPV
jgi:ribosome-associated protein